MVWVSNQASVTITVQISNHTGGSPDTFTIYPKQNEKWEINHWTRKGNEKATIKLAGGKTHVIEVTKDAFVKVFDDAILHESFVATQI